MGKAEQKYETTRKELLAVVNRLKQFRQYLLGRHFIIRTDHAALSWLRQTAEPMPQLARWLTFIEQFDYEVLHAKRILVLYELKIKTSGGNNFIDFPENQLTNFVLNVKPTNSTSSRLSVTGSTVSFGRGRKSFVFVLQMVFLDDSVGNNTLRKWEHWFGAQKQGPHRLTNRLSR